MASGFGNPSAPIGNSKDVVYFGRINFRSSERLFGIKRRDRRQHTYVIGKSGTGKSALLHNMIVQDIANGDGVCVVDPHGELVESVIENIPASRVKDVVYFNPADTDFHLGFNVLELPDPKYKHLVASGLMAIFTKIWANVWSARMEYIMNNAILALLETPGTTLLGITRILVDKEYRQKIVSNVKDPVVKAFWVNEYEAWRDQFRNEAIAPIQNKVGQFLSTSLIRNVVGQSKSTIDIYDIMNTRKIFLVNVSKGRIGEDNSALLGAMLITKIQLAAMERIRIPEDDRADFYLYVDEFQNFATDSFAGILSEARKYRLDLILAHQYVGQLVTGGSGSNVVSTKVRDAVFGNVGTMMVFRVGAADAEFLENEFSPEFTIEDIVNLPNYNIYLKLMVDGVASRPFSAATLPPFKTQSTAASTEEISTSSRNLYARPREVVEREIRKWSGMADLDEDDDEEPRVEGSFAHPLPPRERREAPAHTAAPAASASSAAGKFPITCDRCGKKAMVNFKPTPGRPIYCSECFAKVKEETPATAPVAASAQEVRTRREERQESRVRDNSALAELGIEFERPTAKAPTPPTPGRSGQAAPAPVSTPTPTPPSRMSTPRPPTPMGSGQAESRGSGAEQPSVREESKPQGMSLSELKPRENEQKRPHLPRKASAPVDVSELRDALKEALDKE